MSKFGFTVILLCMLNLFVEANEGLIVFTAEKPRRDLYSFEQSIGRLGGDRRQGSKKPWWEVSTRDIYTIRPDGTDQRQLTDDGMSTRPEWSPDGRWIAYIHGAPPKESLIVMRQDGSEKRKLIDRQVQVRDFWWSTDSSSLLATIETRKSSAPLEGWIVTVENDKPKRLGNPRWAQGWNHWHALDTEIINPQPRLLKALPEDTNWPEWSHDRRFIAFIADGRLATADVEAVSATQRWFAQQKEPPANLIEEWSWDDTKVLFYVSGYICVATVTDGVIEEIWNLSRHRAGRATFNYAGDRVAFTSRQHNRENTEIYVMDLDGNHQVQITNTNYNHFEPDWR